MTVENNPTGSDPGAPPAPEPRGSKAITCEACESVLHASGDVKRKSESLKALEKIAENRDSWKLRAEEAERKLTELQTNPPAPVVDPSPAPEPEPRRKHLHLSVD